MLAKILKLFGQKKGTIDEWQSSRWRGHGRHGNDQTEDEKMRFALGEIDWKGDTMCAGVGRLLPIGWGGGPRVQALQAL